MLFTNYLQENHGELFDRAGELEIDLSTFDSLYDQYGAEVAVKALQDIIKSRGKKEDVKIDHPQNFMRMYKDDLDTLIEAYDIVRGHVEDYSNEYGVRIIIDLDDDTPVRLGRAKRGSKMRPPRDLRILYRYLKDNKLSTKIRVRASDDDTYEHAEILASGEIKTNIGEVYKELKHWTTDVFRRGVDRKTRTTVVGSPWKACQIKNKDDQWVPIDRLWNIATGILDDEDEDEQ